MTQQQFETFDELNQYGGEIADQVNSGGGGFAECLWRPGEYIVALTKCELYNPKDRDSGLVRKDKLNSRIEFMIFDENSDLNLEKKTFYNGLVSPDKERKNCAIATNIGMRQMAELDPAYWKESKNQANIRTGAEKPYTVYDFIKATGDKYVFQKEGGYTKMSELYYQTMQNFGTFGDDEHADLGALYYLKYELTPAGFDKWTITGLHADVPTE